MQYPNSTLHELFAERAKIQPDFIALEFEDKQFTYNDVSEMANQMANYLWSQGLRPGQIVGIALDRTPELIACFFAVLQCGSSYVPIDTSYPEERIKLIIEDAEAAIFISKKANLIYSKNTSSFAIEDVLESMSILPAIPLDLKVSSYSTAYIMYTSGSTGKPKGVQVAHYNLINVIYSMAKAPGMQSDDRIFAVTSISFDAMVVETFLPLLFGACIILVNEETKRDGNLLLKKAVEDKITILFQTPSMWQILIDTGWATPLPIKAFTGGESLTRSLADDILARCDELWNHYGPTETSVCSLISQVFANNEPVTIGTPVANTTIYLLDSNKNVVNPGEVGEIVIAGDGVSLGYLNRPELNNEKFLTNPFENLSHSKMYFSGDLGKLLPNGHLHCLGRIDDQVKIRGNRVELGEIESIINNLPEIKKAAVIVSNRMGAEPSLVAYLQSIDAKRDTSSIRQKLENLLPAFLIPSFFMWVSDFPLTTNGKIDKKNLPAPEYLRPDSAPILRKPTTKIEKEIAKVWTEMLQIPIIGIDDNFFELGGTSLLAQRVATKLRQHYNLQIPVTKIYQYPTIAELSHFLTSDTMQVEYLNSSKPKQQRHSSDVAIIGMSGRFPGADSIEELWDILKVGKETITFFTENEIDPSIPESLRNDPLYVAARGILPKANTFDADFFGINPKLAEVMDPQQRLFLEISWEALEQAGYLPRHFTGLIGIYAGAGTNTYYKKNILNNTDVLEQIGHTQAETVNEKDYIATRTAYHLNIKGPAVSVHSACSTSLLAIAQAAEAIRNGQCEIALAGASSITSPVFSGHLYQEGSMLSADGHCRAFDASGKGTVFSDGAGVVLLKSLESAVNDGDKIYGVIKGIGITNDGGNKGSFTAPSAEGQAAAISSALKDAQLSPDTISYVETHGTATPIGDPIEIEGLTIAYGNQPRNGYCAIGSIKTNMGHLTAAAGVAGLIKTILAMNNKLIPASLGFEKPNPAIDFENSPFYVNAKLSSWNSDTPLRAGVSSFGVGGTNVHLIVEEYPIEQKVSSSSRPVQLLMWSAKSDVSLKGYATELGKFIQSKPDIQLADIAYSLNKTRDTFAHRSFLVYSDSGAASQELLSKENSTLKTAVLKVVPSEIVFLFPGQGAQFSQMGMNLYKNETVYKEAVDKCSEFLLDELKLDIREILFPEIVTADTEAKLKDTRFTQPALFVTEYALSQLWLSWGIKPTAYCGHSIGEFVAAHLAGIFSLEDALHLIATRGRLVSELPQGSMLSVRLSEDKLKEILPETLSIAAINSNVICVVSGENETIAEFSNVLDQKEIANKLLFTSHAFHSKMMDPILEIFEAEVKRTQLHKPNLPIVSTVTGTWLKDDEATNPQYWTNHLRNTVRFADATNTLLKLEDILFLEVGPGQTLTALTKQQGAGKIIPAFTSLLLPKNQETEYHSILNTLGELWLQGINPDWDVFYASQNRQKVNLPSYVFDRKLCWVNPPMAQLQISRAIPIENQNLISSVEDNKSMRKSTILDKIASIVSQTSGVDYPQDASSLSFLDLGLDSLTLTQLAIRLKKDFKLSISFRQLNEEFSSPSLLADFLDHQLPKEEYNESLSLQSIPTSGLHSTSNQNTPLNNQNNSTLDAIVQQLQLLGKQIELLQGNSASDYKNEIDKTPYGSQKELITSAAIEEVRTPEEIAEHQKPFGAAPRIEKQAKELSYSQKEYLDKLIASYTKKTAASKSSTQKYRPIMADPRVVTGFKPLTKEIVYPIVVEKSSGNRLWDLDGNVYLDALNGFGSCMFGHQADFIKEALHHQIETGFEVGPQHPLAGEVCELLCEFTKHDRAALCNTGSEAVLGAMRIARTVTGRSLIVAFSGSYHGINDEALVRGSKKLITFPASAGILAESVQNMLILEYGTPESLRIIAERAAEIAAVLVEPVQSRRPEFQPVAFLKELRELTAKFSVALVFDEVITGFRMHPGGAQALFNIQADIATYGKVIGGGLSIGAITGKRKYLDALDGGHWDYGDHSIPEVGVTYFAGTFVRHPLTLAASKASLLHLKEQGPALQERLNDMTSRLASELNSEFIQKGLPMVVNHFGSLWRLKFNDDVLYGDLLFASLRENGIHIYDGFPCFMTEAFEDKDVLQIINTFKKCIEEMVLAGFFGNTKSESERVLKESESETNKAVIIDNPPMPGARLGRDEDGNPAWFIEDPNAEGEYIKVAI
ncbi:amino acid adenylation domain-containing protein [Flavobacterium nackdongense]|uniref:Amino acid adenylation domain-containing protein n=2 Tax=Flavobacterium nackdongense TaxID=2547394 RepID=A0A4P6YBU9_9FLAO|nr:amino acid adenylation domain-containing protein [Flavobacterium nackdongense]